MEEEKLLSREQVAEVVQFAQGLALADGAFFSPMMSNQILNNLNNKGIMPSYNKLVQALKTYKESADDLQAYTEFMQKFDMLFARTLRSYSNILAFDLQVIPAEDYSDEELNSKEFAEDKKRIYKFLDAFDYKAEFQKMMLEVMRHETVFTWFRKTKWGNKGMKGTLQIMPQNYCLLTDYWEKGLLYDFDMTYFLNAGVDIDGFDPIFKEYYRKVFLDNELYDKYKPTNPLSDRSGTYAMWVQTSPEKGAWTFKFDMANFNGTPFLAPFLKDTLRDAEVESLQYDKDIATAYGILAGEIRLFDNAKSGTKANQFAIDPKTLGTFMGAVKKGLGSRINAVAMPTENTHFYQYSDTNKEMYDNQLKTTAGVGSSISRVIYSSDKMGNAELQYATEAQYQIMKPMYAQFQNFMNYFANKMTKKFKFSFIFEGCAYEYEREKRFERLMKYADKGIVLNETAYASALGMRPQDFERSLNQSFATKWTSKLQLLLNTNTSKDGSANGRPTLSDTDISDSGEASRDM